MIESVVKCSSNKLKMDIREVGKSKILHCIKSVYKPGFNYQLQYSDDLISWKSNLPGSLLSTDEEQITNFTDNSNSLRRTRQYRVYRSEQ